MVDLDAAQAAIRAGYSARTARHVGSRLLTKVDIAAEARPPDEAEEVAVIVGI
jgi:phage terminase small subunit